MELFVPQDTIVQLIRQHQQGVHQELSIMSVSDNLKMTVNCVSRVCIVKAADSQSLRVHAKRGTCAQQDLPMIPLLPHHPVIFRSQEQLTHYHVLRAHSTTCRANLTPVIHARNGIIALLELPLCLLIAQPDTTVQLEPTVAHCLVLQVPSQTQPN